MALVRSRLLSHNFSSLHHKNDVFHVCDIGQWVAAHCDDVSKFPYLKAADLIGQSEEFCGIYRGRLEGFGWLHAALNQGSKLLIQEIRIIIFAQGNL